ncbi:uncharacterized protein SCHCODRAFT_02641432 [Schizophyllum commune H4-8]|uniref:uncharacterized protein n=1 Tax=Schizophyllum commune (strain H4-8 / FGSC 9210) TaxID=578458 RepID=UPI00215F43DA|nr:uncharacterized protein SCHCODRAFT_02641432 [Schizophyllum commune H4-8]KAI5886320.1 hypothetical protein SCHCODRAFT_02641432 [Schizophyllum commune H4-8]
MKRREAERPNPSQGLGVAQQSRPLPLASRELDRVQLLVAACTLVACSSVVRSLFRDASASCRWN